MTQIEYDKPKTISFDELEAEWGQLEDGVKNASFETVLTMLKDSVDAGGGGAEFLRKSFISWYRPSSETGINLCDYENLDRKNRALFKRMLGLRLEPKWDDELLFQLERYLRVLEG